MRKGKEGPGKERKREGTSEARKDELKSDFRGDERDTTRLVIDRFVNR